MTQDGRGAGSPEPVARSRPDSGDPGGPLVALCLGRQCAERRARAGTTDTVPLVRAAVRGTPGAVLVTAGCLGPCEMAAVAAVARRDGVTGRCGRTVWLGGMHDAQRVQALGEWVCAGGPGRSDAAPDAGLPVSLIGAVAGVGVPMRIQPDRC